MRRGEVCGLQWGDLDVASGTLTVSRAVVSVPDGTIVKDTKTHAVRRLAARRGDCDPAGRVCSASATNGWSGSGCRPWLPRGFVFSLEPFGTQPWHPDTATHAFRRLSRKVGLTGVRLHDLRHLHATQLLAAGVPVRTVSGRLGHAQTSTTLNVYAHALEASDRDAALTFSRLIETASPSTSRKDG